MLMSYIFSFHSNCLLNSIGIGVGTLNRIVSFSLTYFRKCCKAAVDPLSFPSTQLCVPIKPRALGEATLQPTPCGYAPFFFFSYLCYPYYGKESWIKQKNWLVPWDPNIHTGLHVRGERVCPECEALERGRSPWHSLNLLIPDLQDEPSLPSLSEFGLMSATGRRGQWLCWFACW